MLAIKRCPEGWHLVYHAANRQAGRYIGQVQMQLKFQGEKGDFFYWLHVDPETLMDHAETAVWKFKSLHQGETGDYLAKLERLSAK